MATIIKIVGSPRNNDIKAICNAIVKDVFLQTKPDGDGDICAMLEFQHYAWTPEFVKNLRLGVMKNFANVHTSITKPHMYCTYAMSETERNFILITMRDTPFPPKDLEVFPQVYHYCACCHDKEATAMCGGCNKVKYCGVECQKKDWKRCHKAQCGKI